MTTRKRKLFGHLGLMCGLSLAIAVPLTPARAAEDSRAEAGKLEGTWLTQVAGRDCATGVILRTFSAINTFNVGQTMLDTTAGAPPAQRSPGMGKWEKTGPQTYSAISFALLFNPVGVWTGTQKLTHTIEVTGNQSNFTSRSEIFDPAGTLVVSGCATAIGQRI